MFLIWAFLPMGYLDYVQVEDLAFLEGAIVALTEQFNEAKAKAKQQEAVAIAAKEQLLRSMADFENYRRRTVNVLGAVIPHPTQCTASA